MSKIQRRRLEAEVVEGIKAMILDGQLIGSLPGIYRLAQDFGVSRRPVEAALKSLEAESWISAVQPGGRREVLGPPESEKLGLQIGVFTPPREVMHSAGLRQSLARVESALEQMGAQLTRFTVSEEREPMRDWTRRKVLSKDSSVKRFDGLVTMFVQPEFLYAHGTEGVPIFELGKIKSSISRVSRVFFNTAKIIRSLFAGALERGIEEVGLLQWDVHDQLHHSYSEGLRELFSSFGAEFRPDLHLPRLSSSKLEEQLEVLFANHQPKYLICQHGQAWARLMLSPHVRYSEASLQSLINDNCFLACEKPPVGVSLNYDECAEAAREWLTLVRQGSDECFEREVGFELCR